MLRRILALLFPVTICLFVLACSKNSQERAREKTTEAEQKTKQEARKLTQELKQGAKSLDRKVDQALSQPIQTNGPSEAEEKLRRGGEKLRVAGDQAAVKLDHAAMLAKIKAKLATDVGVSTVTGVDVDTSGQVVTLRGTVSSPEQRQQAEQAVLQVTGVTKVINDLRVQP